MREKRKLRLLLSLADKKGIIDFVKKLAETFLLEVVATQGTADCLNKAGIKVKTIEEISGFPPILSGRVKSLHPKIFGAVLADRDNLDHQQQLDQFSLEPFDMVVVNLYPFSQTVKKKNISLKEAVEQIDIGGTALLRAAAKNFQSIIVITDINDYSRVVELLKSKKGISFKQRKKYAQKVFRLVSNYDKLIFKYLKNV